jgi:hypothetical protein
LKLLLVIQDVFLSEQAVQKFKTENPSINVVWSNAPSQNHLMAMRTLSQYFGAVVHFVSKEEANNDIDCFVVPGYRVAIDGDSLTWSQREVAMDILPALENIEGLSTLELNGFFLRPANMHWLSKLPTVRSLRLDMMRIGTPKPWENERLRCEDYIASLPLLESLSLHKADIRYGSLAWLKQLTNLWQIDLSWTSISDAGMSTLARIENLEQIVLDGTKFSGRGIAELRHLKSLRRLELSATEISDSDLTTLATIKSIEALDLSFTGVTDAGLARLRGMPHLREINLCGAQISDKGLEFLADLPSLEAIWLIVDGNRVTNAGIRKLQTASPQLQITRLGELR